MSLAVHNPNFECHVPQASSLESLHRDEGIKASDLSQRLQKAQEKAAQLESALKQSMRMNEELKSQVNLVHWTLKLHA